MATKDELYKELATIEAWLELARQELDEGDFDETSYEFARAAHWVGHLEDLRHIKLRHMKLVFGVDP